MIDASEPVFGSSHLPPFPAGNGIYLSSVLPTRLLYPVKESPVRIFPSRCFPEAARSGRLNIRLLSQ